MLVQPRNILLELVTLPTVQPLLTNTLSSEEQPLNMLLVAVSFRVSMGARLSVRSEEQPLNM